MFEGNDIAVFAGPMVIATGTSLQNRDLLNFSTNRLGNYRTGNGGFLLPKAIQSASKNQKKCAAKVRYAYYALIIHLKPKL
jgi:hypothetical protein